MPLSGRFTSSISPCVVADDGADRHLRRDVAGHALAHRLQPLLHEVVLLAAHLERLVGGGLDVGGDVQHLLESLALVQALGEAQPGAGDRRERLAPAHQVSGEVGAAPKRRSRGRPYGMQQRTFDLGPVTLVDHLRAAVRAHVERVDDLRADGLHRRMTDVEAELGERDRQPVQQSRGCRERAPR